MALVLGKAAKSPAAAAARGLVMGVVIVVRTTIHYNYLRFVDILDLPPTRSSTNRRRPCRDTRVLT